MKLYTKTTFKKISWANLTFPWEIRLKEASLTLLTCYLALERLVFVAQTLDFNNLLRSTALKYTLCNYSGGVLIFQI